MNTEEIAASLADLWQSAPNWEFSYYPNERLQWVAVGPTFDMDGVKIVGPDPEELLERVRTHEHIIALAAARAGNAHRPIIDAGYLVDPRADHELAEEVVVKTVDSGTSKMEKAKSMGYTGIACESCGSFNTVRVGKCLRCETCQHAGECG